MMDMNAHKNISFIPDFLYDMFNDDALLPVNNSSQAEESGAI